MADTESLEGVTFDFDTHTVSGGESTLKDWHDETGMAGMIDARSNPDAFTAAVKELLSEDATKVISDPPSGAVTLLGGWVNGSELITHAQVRELRGSDEELLSKALAANDFTRYIDTIVHCGTTALGDVDDKALSTALDELCIGDRDLLVHAVRVATFGPNMELDVTCPLCSAEFKIKYDFDNDVSVKPMTSRLVQEVVLPSGKTVTVKLIDGVTQKAVYTPDRMAKLNPAEINTMVIARCITHVERKALHNGTQTALELSMADRREVLRLITEQPGPDYDAVTQDCPECSGVFPLVVDVRTMFRG